MPERTPYRLLRGLPFFTGLPESDISFFSHESCIKHYPKGRHLFRHGDRGDRLFIIVEGWIKLYRVTVEGGETIVALLTRGDIFGEAVIYGKADYTASAEVAADVCLIEVPAGILKERTRMNADIAVRIMAAMAREINKLQMESEHKALMEAPQRVGCLLLQLASGMDGSGGTFSFPYDKALAAQRLGMRPETFSRALAQLRPVGVTSNGAEITIASFSRLTDYCCGQCSGQMSDCKGAEIKAKCPGKAFCTRSHTK